MKGLETPGIAGALPNALIAQRLPIDEMKYLLYSSH
jgi:hypothetical protein